MGWLLADVNADSAIRVGDEPFELGCVDRSGVHVEAARASAEGLDWRIKSIDRAEVYKAHAAGASDVIFPLQASTAPLQISTIGPQDVTHPDVHLCVLESFCRIKPHHCHGAAVRAPRRRLYTVDRGTVLLGIHVILVVLPKAHPHQQQCADRQEAAFESGGST
jgi:hypothetical protein